MTPEAALDRFRDIPLTPFAEVSDTRTFSGGSHAMHVVLGVCTHGDEVGPLAAALDLLDDLCAGRLNFGGRITVIVGNPEAMLAGKRCLEADLNRVFTEQAPDSLEKRRATELRRVLDTADVFLDVHQTILPVAQPFFIGPYGKTVGDWMRAIGTVEAWVTREPGSSFSAGTCCADEYVRLRGKAGFTIELGQRGFSRFSRAMTSASMRRLLSLADRVAAGADLATLAADEPPMVGWETVAAVRWEPTSLALRPGFVNFAEVREGEQLAATGSPSLLAPCDGAVLFPKYPPEGAPRPLDIVNIVRRMSESPTERWGARD